MDFTQTGKTVYSRTYSRTKQDGTKETWPETVERVVDGNLALAGHHFENEREDLIRMITEFKIIPAGRHLWASGVQGRQYLFNCHVAGWGDNVWDHFEFTFLRLMEGGGVGANYSNKYLDKYPHIQSEYKVHIVCDPEHADYEELKKAGVLSTDFVGDWSGAFEVEDSREGWAAALVDLFDAYYRGAIHPNRVFDVSRVRPEGSRLKTFGGRASGPLPLAKMLHNVSTVLNDAWDETGYLTGMDAMTIDHHIAECVVSGGNRRSARMSIMHWADEQIEDFLAAKAVKGLHWTTNISVEVDDNFWLNASVMRAGEPTAASQVLKALSEGMVLNGEPGFWNSDLSNIGEPNPVACTNPCLVGDTIIATLAGPRTFKDLADDGKDVEVYSWDPETKLPVVRWMRRPHKTAERVPVLRVTFDSGLVVTCTPDHEFFSFRGGKVEARDLRVGSSVRAFSASRDSSGHERVHAWDSEKNAAVHQWTHRMVYENEFGPVSPRLQVAHLDGDATNNGLENLSVMTPYEHASYDYPKRQAAGFGGKARNHKVVAVEPRGDRDVYNGMVEGSHTYIILDPEPVAGHMSGIVSANCGEIALNEWEPCCLGHVNLAAFVDEWGSLDLEELEEAHRLMTRFLIRATFGDVNDPKQAAVLARNRRIGVGHLGVANALAMMGVRYSDAARPGWFGDVLSELYRRVMASAIEYSHDLRIPVPVKVTTVAPTGTIAKMPGVSEGVHPIFAKYFVRRIRFSTVDPDQRKQVEDYAAQGYLVENCLYAPQTVVVAIPTKDSLVEEVERRYGAGAVDDLVQSAADLELEDFLRFQQMYQEQWADNAVSYTINIDPERYSAEELQKALVKWGPYLKGVTVFPESSMPQAPYERLTREEYDAAVATEVADGVDEDCTTGACPVR